MARNGICSPLILVCASIIIHVSIASDVSFLFSFGKLRVAH